MPKVPVNSGTLAATALPKSWELIALGSIHANPLRPVHADSVSRASGQIKCDPTSEGTSVIDGDGNRLPVLRVGHCYLRSKRKRAMSGRISVNVESLTARRSSTGNIVCRNYTLPGATGARFGMRKEPSEAAAACLPGRRDKKDRDQTGDTK
jgi:hypothetical protein